MIAEYDWIQAYLVEKLGISRQAVILIEKYKYIPSLEVAFKIAEVFNVSINEVFQYKEYKNKSLIFKSIKYSPKKT